MKKKRSLQELPNYERAKRSRIYAEEEMERIEAIGQKSESSGAKWAREDFKEKEREELKFKENAFIKLGPLKKNKTLYNRFLRGLFRKFAEGEDIPEKYTIWTKANKKGLVVGILGTNLTGAFQSVGIEEYDFMACKILAIKLGNTIAKLEGNYQVSQGGIAIPDELDKKKYDPRINPSSYSK